MTAQEKMLARARSLHAQRVQVLEDTRTQLSVTNPQAMPTTFKLLKAQAERQEKAVDEAAKFVAELEGASGALPLEGGGKPSRKG